MSAATSQLLRTGLVAIVAAALTTIPARGQQDTLRQAGAQLVVNLPATRLDVFHEGGLIRSYRVAIGSRGYPTPIGEFELSEVVWNPWWVPPASDWARNQKAQPPGANNPMGRAKLRFSDFYYLHGTADVSSIGRAASHGCIRLTNEDAIDLARIILAIAEPGIPVAHLDSLERNPRSTRPFPLDCRVPLSIRYQLAEVRDTVLELYADPYRLRPDLRAEAVAALARAGFTSADLDLSRLDAVLESARPLSRRVPLREIVLPETWRRIRSLDQNQRNPVPGRRDP